MKTAGRLLYLYRLRGPPDTARALLLDYVRRINGLRERPEWYKALTQNRTTAIPRHSGTRSWRNWRLLANGYLDELAYEIGAVDTRLPFAELRARSHVNDRAREAGDAPDFSHRIRRDCRARRPDEAAGPAERARATRLARPRAAGRRRRGHHGPVADPRAG